MEDIGHPPPTLTAEGRSSPPLNDDAGVLASGGVALDALAEDLGVPFGEAKVVEASSEIEGRVDEVVAGAEGTFWEGEEAAVVGSLEDLHLLPRADGAVVLGAVVTARRVGRFPGRAEDGRVGRLLVTGEEEIVAALAVVVAAEPAKVAPVALGERERHVVEEVIAYDEAEVGLEEDARPVLVHPHPSLAQGDREVVGYGVHLGRGVGGRQRERHLQGGGDGGRNMGGNTFQPPFEGIWGFETGRRSGG